METQFWRQIQKLIPFTPFRIDCLLKQRENNLFNV